MKRILHLTTPAVIACTASAVGKEEYEGPYRGEFDFHDDTDLFGSDTWEHAEAALSGTTLNLLFQKAGISHSDVDLCFSGDLENQCVASSEGLTPFKMPYCGLYAACSTSCEGLILGSIAINANLDLQNVCIVTTSHHCAAERQFRLPLEYGGQRTPTAQWTATAGGGFLLRPSGKGARVTEVMFGRTVDAGISDAANMGAAMAPSTVDTLTAYFRESGRIPSDFDAIITGDLGKEGSDILHYLMEKEGYSLKNNHYDCGKMIYDGKTKDVHSGGSGCGCSASLMAAHFLPEIAKGNLKNVLFMATGALMSPGSLQQGGHIVGISPLCRIECGEIR